MSERSGDVLKGHVENGGSAEHEVGERVGEIVDGDVEILSDVQVGKREGEVVDFLVESVP